MASSSASWSPPPRSPPSRFSVIPFDREARTAYIQAFMVFRSPDGPVVLTEGYTKEDFLADPGGHGDLGARVRAAARVGPHRCRRAGLRAGRNARLNHLDWPL